MIVGTAAAILNLLEAKHSKDLFVPECKNGPTQDGYRRLDAWVMARSWRHPKVTGYEIKVSRSDFLQDEKWHDYLPMCNCLAFVCPYGLIQPEEAPENVGLLWTSRTGTRLYTKRKPVYRKVEIPDSVYLYVLMCRARITNELMFDRDTRAQGWEDWLRRKIEMKNLGYRVSQRIREYLESVNEDNHELMAENNALRVIRDRLTELGIDPEKRVSEWEASGKLEEVLTGIPKDLEWSLRRVVEDGGQALTQLQKFREINEAKGASDA